MTTVDVTGQLARYMAAARDLRPAPHVGQEAKHRILDTLAAMVSGSHLQAGEMAIRFTRAQGGVAEATVLTTDIRTSAVNAALANGMFAHADETDDFEPVTKAHPGSHVVPAALAMAEREGRSGAELLAAVTLGYDVCCRFLLALGPDLVRGSHRSAEGTSSTMGAAAAAASLAKLDEKGMRYALSYAAQQVSGLWSWVRDPEHVEKAFDFSGMGARNGVTAAIMAQMGFTGVWDVLDGEHNALIALSTDPNPEEMVAGLGSRFFVTETAIKPFSADSGASRCVSHAPSRAQAECGQRRANCRQAPGGWRPYRQRPLDAGRQLSAHHRARTGGGRRFLRRQPLVRADGGSEGARREGACATHRRSSAHGSRRPPKRARGGDAARRPQDQSLHAPSPGHEGESAEHREGQRKGTLPDDAGAGRRTDRGGHSAGKRAGKA
jgi:2-methylcitrate dehydratase MmgE/PrpD-like protein